MPGPTPLFGERALSIPEERTLVLGDLHVGLEAELRTSGIRLPSQTWRMRERAERLVALTGAERLVLLGDLKHSIPTSTADERMDLPDFLDNLAPHVDLVRGNHDVDLGVLPPEVEVRPATGIRVGDVGLLHGHTWPDEEVMAARTIVICHNHPMVLLKDELGHRHKEPCWVRTSFTDAARERYPALPEDARLVVMPAFNDLLGGVAFNGPDRPMGPLFANGLAEIEDARLWTLDGVDLGTVADLRAFGEEAPLSRGRRGRRRRRR